MTKFVERKTLDESLGIIGRGAEILFW